MAHMTVEHAQSFIKSHSLEVFITPEGLVIRDEAGYFAGPNANPVALADSDVWFEELQAFPIDTNGMVDMSPVKAWLGY